MERWLERSCTCVDEEDFEYLVECKCGMNNYPYCGCDRQTAEEEAAFEEEEAYQIRIHLLVPELESAVAKPALLENHMVPIVLVDIILGYL